MIKKILPIVALIGASTMIVGISNSTPSTEKKEAFINHFNSFKEDIVSYTSLNTSALTKTALNKYTLSVQDDLENIKNLEEIQQNNTNEQPLNQTQTPNDLTLSQNVEDNLIDEQELNLDNVITTDEIEEISTLYSLSNDIEESCGDFCKLKENVTSAIVETQNLINKLQNKEIELNNEQRLFITEQAQQLKNLGRQLSNITTELTFNLSDINYIMTSNNEDFNNLSLKYLVVLDNLVNGNEMLQSSLTSLNLINQMFNMNSNNIPSNNQGRILYGFKHNNNPPVIKDYYIDENGEVIENSENPTPSIETNEQTENLTENKSNIDTYSNNKLNSNIDTYNNNNLPNNIDTFFNTALLDNEFMYGNNGYGNGVYGMNNPYMQNYTNYERNNTINGDNQQGNTQDTNNTETKKSNKKEKKRFELKKNIDTYKDANEPSVKTKLGNIKNSITGFFSKFKKTDITDKIENPVYREEIN